MIKESFMWNNKRKQRCNTYKAKNSFMIFAHIVTKNVNWTDRDVGGVGGCTITIHYLISFLYSDLTSVYEELDIDRVNSFNTAIYNEIITRHFGETPQNKSVKRVKCANVFSIRNEVLMQAITLYENYPHV